MRATCDVKGSVDAADTQVLVEDLAPHIGSFSIRGDHNFPVLRQSLDVACRDLGLRRNRGRVRGRNNKTIRSGDDGPDGLDLARTVSGAIEDVEHLPDILSDNRINQRQRQTVEIDIGQRLDLAGLGFVQPAQHALRRKARHRNHEQRDNQGHASRDR
jgi:hypothetical protein